MVYAKGCTEPVWFKICLPPSSLILRNHMVFSRVYPLNIVIMFYKSLSNDKNFGWRLWDRYKLLLILKSQNVKRKEKQIGKKSDQAPFKFNFMTAIAKLYTVFGLGQFSFFLMQPSMANLNSPSSRVVKDSTPSRRRILRCINFGIGESSPNLFLDVVNLYLIKSKERWILNWTCVLWFYYFVYLKVNLDLE